MAKKIVFTKEQKEDIIKRYQNRETTRKIGKIYGCSKQTIGRFLKANNIELVVRSQSNKLLAGEVYGKLTVIKEGPRSTYIEKGSKLGRRRYWCECSCGLICVLVLKRNLTYTGQSSCGLCIERDDKGRFPQNFIPTQKKIKDSMEEAVDYLAGFFINQ